ncbi:carbohydrate-binding module family 18 protein [Piedraia hortae CBS 480.64]|uniref:Carbohydrate-binding module family 18 protein n=1 Tax=Piedraia hortae CBS 480.64 TaxID=1314780 RepID=A0A6A7BW21_9PEZI|nr:carbohydrate-binding module family 18 protein [Piedraia hortae CBS 480.64]
MHCNIALVAAAVSLVGAIPHSGGHVHRHPQRAAQHLAQRSPASSPLASLAGRAADNNSGPIGQCGGTSGITCPQGLCCSPFNFCGVGPNYCGTGCQPGYGTCSSANATGATGQNDPNAPHPTSSAGGPPPNKPTSDPVKGNPPPSPYSGGQGSDSYKHYTGNGEPSSGWPSQDSWVSFDHMWNSNLQLISSSCVEFSQTINSKDENNDLKSAIQSVANDANIDPRFVLAIVMQESKGCVRAPTTTYSVPNPGLMQSHDGSGTCNSAGSGQVPCPSSTIEQMVRDGVDGTASGDGLKQGIARAGCDDVSRYYKAARIYNSGSIPSSGDLGAAGATTCYASDIANRLTGWVNAPHGCTS